jgi:hypothetical protein
MWRAHEMTDVNRIRSSQMRKLVNLMFSSIAAIFFFPFRRKPCAELYSRCMARSVA